MKTLALIFTLLLSPLVANAQTTEMETDMFETMHEGDKAVVVAVHNVADRGEARDNIQAFNDRIRKAYPHYDFKEASTTKGGAAPTPDALFSQLHKDGYTHVLVQSSELTNNTDMQYLRHVVDAAKDKFKQMRLGEPLLNDLQDYEKVAKAAAEFGKPKEINIMVCGDNASASNAQYTMLEHVLRNDDNSWNVVMVDGYPTIDSLMKQLKRQKNKKVNLVPFMFANRSIACAATIKEWTQKLQKAGYKVSTEMRNIGGQDAIIDLFESHIRHAEHFRSLSAKEMKMVIK